MNQPEELQVPLNVNIWSPLKTFLGTFLFSPVFLVSSALLGSVFPSASTGSAEDFFSGQTDNCLWKVIVMSVPDLLVYNGLLAKPNCRCGTTDDVVRGDKQWVLKLSALDRERAETDF